MTDDILEGSALKHHVTSSMGQFFFDQAERFSDRICQIDTRLNKKETYSDVKQRSVRAALALQNRGVISEDVVVLCTKLTLDNVVPIVASFFLGAKLANLDPSLSVRQTTHLLSLVSPKIIFVEEESLGLIEESLAFANLKAEIVVFGKSSKYSTFSEFVKPQENENKFKPTSVDIHDIAVIFFSSGTTGLPKAICHSHHSFLNVGYSFIQSGINCDVILSFTSFYWVSAMIILTTSFIVGGHRIFCGPMDAEKTFTIIDKYKVTMLFLAPILTYKLTNFDGRHSYDTSSLKHITTGGTPISATQLERISTVFNHSDILFVYGCTEAGIVSTFNPITEQVLMRTKLGSCGKAAPGMTIKIVDVSTNQTLGANQKGEVCVKSCTTMKGYYKAASTAAFDSDGFLKTGDIGYYDSDGCLYVIERLKEMFKYLSWHVVPSSIEAVLLEHPGIKEAVVFGTPKSEEEGEVPTACVILKEKGCVREEEIEEFVEKRVSDYERLRGGVIFVDELQKTPSGKLMRKEIRNNILRETTKL
ncbi:hypothetical protein Zmor_008576 [Zophobas morio]|uniref:Luciferin 4-monooxygenase n=1 Tax=Zophobas morio TaxID=2755281 RepID=A0AA38MPW6_9CUCU|nr:hypothetical protein Zmor_008576 [Zophobas morio]